MAKESDANKNGQNRFTHFHKTNWESNAIHHFVYGPWTVVWSITFLCMYVLMAQFRFGICCWYLIWCVISTMNVKIFPPPPPTEKKYSIEIHARSKRKESFIQWMELPHIFKLKEEEKIKTFFGIEDSEIDKHVFKWNEKKNQKKKNYFPVGQISQNWQ